MPGAAHEDDAERPAQHTDAQARRQGGAGSVTGDYDIVDEGQVRSGRKTEPSMVATCSAQGLFHIGGLADEDKDVAVLDQMGGGRRGDELVGQNILDGDNGDVKFAS